MPTAAHSLLGVSLLLCAPAIAHAHPGEVTAERAGRSSGIQAGGGSMTVSVVGSG